MEDALFEIGEDLALLAGSEWNDAWVGMFGDVLLRRVILHFLLCRAALALHKEYGQMQDFQPTCFPPFPEVRCNPTSKKSHPRQGLLQCSGEHLLMTVHVDVHMTSGCRQIYLGRNLQSLSHEEWRRGACLYHHHFMISTAICNILRHSKFFFCRRLISSLHSSGVKS